MVEGFEAQGVEHVGDLRVAGVLEAAATSAGAPVQVSGFSRFALGAGIEKQTTDFAAEVAAQLDDDDDDD